MKKRKWVGFDLDGTLAKDPNMKKFNPAIIGEPIPCMVELINKYLEEDVFDVKIFTARLNTKDHHTVFKGTEQEYIECVTRYIDDFCLKNLGRRLEITCEKDYLLDHFYDDRALKVIKDRGWVGLL